jgi:hypothetical protein
MISSRYSCKFEDETGEKREIIVDLSAHEIARARAHAYPDIAAKAYALRHAYRQVPRCFGHCAGGVSPVELN